MLTDADPEVLDAAVGAWLMNLARFATPAAGGVAAGGVDDGAVGGGAVGGGALMQVRLDGKAIRGAKDGDGNQVRLLAALVGPDAAASVVAAQAEVGKKMNEVPMAAVVLGQIGLNNKIVTAGTLHTVKATANHIHENSGEFVLLVTENQQALFDAVDALPWGQVPIACTASQSRPSPHSASPAPGPSRQTPLTWPDTSGNNGRSSPCTGSATPCIKRTNPRSEPETGPVSWRSAR